MINNVTVYRPKNFTGAQTGARYVVDINGALIEGLTDFKIETGPSRHTIMTIAFLVTNIEFEEWVEDDDVSGEWVTGDR